MKTSQEIKMNIMGRVYMAYAMRRIFHSTTLRALLSVGSLFGILSFVSVLNVIKNISHLGSTSDLYVFSVTAFSNTEIAVQLSLLAFIGVVIWYARDIIRAFVSPQSRTQVI